MEDHQIFYSIQTLHSQMQNEMMQNESSAYLFNKNTKNKQFHSPRDSSQISQQDKSLYYFNMFFSPKQTAQSLKKRNDNLEMLNFQNSDEEPDDVFNRRRKKVVDLLTKEQEQLQAICLIKQQDEGKFLGIIEFIKFFCVLKQKIAGLRTDYYSNKTFCALRNARESQLTQLSKIVRKMYSNVMSQSKSNETNSQSTCSYSNKIDERINQFLIIPRFLISKQKIIRLCRDEVLQKNFQFLIYHECLGHYNNEANKKMPQENQMVYVRELLTKKLGREKFKKICSINHGNKFLKNYGQAYYELYSKSLEYLKQLDNYMKKGKKFESIKRDLDKIPQEADEICACSSFTQNQSSNSIYSFGKFNECLNRLQASQENSSIKSELRDQLQQIGSCQKVQMIKRGPRKLMSMTVNVQQKEQDKPRGFNVRKSHTLETKTTENIILVPPPSFNFQI